MRLTKAEYGEITSSFVWLVMQYLKYSRMQFGLMAAQMHGWLTRSLMSASTYRSLSAGLLSSHFTPISHLCLVLLNPQYRIQNLNFKFHTIKRSLMLWSVQMHLQGIWSLKRINSISQFGVISKHPNGAFKSYIQIVVKYTEQSWSRTEPWGTGLLTGHQPDVTQFTTTELTCTVEVCHFSWNCLSERRQHENYCIADKLINLRQTNSYLIYDKRNWFNWMFWYFVALDISYPSQKEDFDGPLTETNVIILDPVFPIRKINLNCCCFLSVSVFSL